MYMPCQHPVLPIQTLGQAPVHPPPLHATEPQLPGPAAAQGAGDDALDDEESEQPMILHLATLSRYEKDKIKRIVTPKKTTGRLEVPKDIFELWQTEKGKEQLMQMWCKSGGVKASHEYKLLLQHFVYVHGVAFV